MITRTLYLEAEEPGNSQLLSTIGYLDDGVTRQEVLKTCASSDNYQGWRRRISQDNGRTWGEYLPIDDVTRQLPGGGVFECRHAARINPATGQSFQIVLKRIWADGKLFTFNWETNEHPFHDHVFIREGDAELQCLRYEDGPEYNPEQLFDPVFAKRNRAYFGCGLKFDQQGRVLFPMVCQPDNARRGSSQGGAVLMRRELSGEWIASNQIFISPEISSRGLLEPDVAVLKDGRILMVCRGSNTATTAGRKWMTMSHDGGRTLEPISELRYSDGTRFYSPSSIHRFMRSTRTGELYWFGNIIPNPPDGNLPRHPLIMARFDEEKLGLIRESVVVVDDVEAGDNPDIWFTNFQIIEDRESLNFELYMTRGTTTFDPDWKASLYRYIIEPT